MKKKFSSYLVCWIMLVALFNIIALFVSAQFKNTTESFWMGYGTVMMAGIVHLGYVLISSREKNCGKRILNVPLVILSYFEIILIIVAGLFFILLPNIPGIVTVIVCSLLIICSVILFCVAKNVGETTADANDKLNTKTGYFRELVDEARLVIEKADEPEKKKILRNFYDAMRYSDPVSSDRARKEEELIDGVIEDLSEKIERLTVDELDKEVKKVLTVLEGRNAECMRSKRG